MTLLIAVLAAVLFGFGDYWGFNTLGQKHLVVYRIIQTASQILLAAGCWALGGHWAAFSFLMLWWCFWADLVYYACCALLKWYPAEPANAFEQNVMGNVVSWAWWTPYGLIRMLFGQAKKTDPINGNILIVQALIGTALAIVIQIIIWW